VWAVYGWMTDNIVWRLSFLCQRRRDSSNSSRSRSSSIGKRA